MGLFMLLLLASSIGCPGLGPHSAKEPLPASNATFRVGTSGDYPPFSDWTRGETHPTGFSLDIARAYAASRDRSVEEIRFEWPGLLTDLERGAFDFAVSGITVRPDRSIAGRFSLPLTTSGAVVLVDENSRHRTLLDLKKPGLRIAVNAGGHLERVSRSLFDEAQVESVGDNHSVLDRLGRDGVEAVMTDTLEAPIWQARRPGLRAIGPLTADRKAAWFPIDAEGEARRFDAWLLRAESEGRLATIRRVHGLPPTRTARPVAALLARLDERLSLMVPVARAKRTLGAEVENREREVRVLDAAIAAVRSEAARIGRETPSETAIRRLYQAQIEAAKWIQQSWIEAEPRRSGEWTAEEVEAARIDLDERIRPALIFLGDRIASLLIHSRSQQLQSLPFEDVVRAFARHALPDRQLRAIHAALTEIGSDADSERNGSSGFGRKPTASIAPASPPPRVKPG